MVSAAQPHTLLTPPPPQVCVPAQLPQGTPERQVPQLSYAEGVPQFLPTRAQKVGLSSAAQPHTLARPLPPQVNDPLQVPQLTDRCWPHKSLPVTVPHDAPMRTQNWVLVSA